MLVYYCDQLFEHVILIYSVYFTISIHVATGRPGFALKWFFFNKTKNISIIQY